MNSQVHFLVSGEEAEADISNMANLYQPASFGQEGTLSVCFFLLLTNEAEVQAGDQTFSTTAVSLLLALVVWESRC